MGKGKKKPVPLVHVMKSRKVQRQVTTAFHQLTHKKEALLVAGKTQASKEVRDLDDQLEAMGGRARYQEASQLSTSIFSTTKWVLGRLGNLNILQGKVKQSDVKQSDVKQSDVKQSDVKQSDVKRSDVKQDAMKQSDVKQEAASSSNKPSRVPINVLEVGAINTQLLTASSKPGVRMTVRSIDLRSTDPAIETQDFLTMEVMRPSVYDAIVCSMVINCVPTSLERGKMLSLLHAQLLPGGHCFLMLPLLCLNNSKFITKKIFENMLKQVGFDIVEEKETPKIYMCVLRKGERGDLSKYEKAEIINRQPKFRNTFAVSFAN